MAIYTAKQITLSAILAAHNRRAKTLACLERLYKQKGLGIAFDLRVYLVDDGSEDGTGPAVHTKFPQVEVIEGNGSLYWNGGMGLAFGEAMKNHYDYYLWLNDDTLLYPNAINLLLTTMEEVRKDGHTKVIIVGSTQDSHTLELSYGGWSSVNRLNPADCVKMQPCEQPAECDTINGNCVLIPGDVAKLVGNLDPIFTHGMGDMDYGFRARNMGCSIWVAPGFVGTCDLNHGEGNWTDTRLSLRARWKKLCSPKGLPPREWFVFTRRHSGHLWLLYWINPYLKFWLRAIL